MRAGAPLPTHTPAHANLRVCACVRAYVCLFPCVREKRCVVMVCGCLCVYISVLISVLP